MTEAEPQDTDRSDVTPEAGPVTVSERIVSLDMLRGVAVLGILVMNIYAFAMPFAGYSNPLAMGGTEAHNLGTWFFTHFLFDQKFLSIFAMLFGAGLIMMWGRAEKRGAKFGRIYFRRQIWLVFIGAFHAYLIWVGDILFAYAALGMIAFLFRKLAPRTLIIFALILISITMALSYGLSIAMEDMRAQAEELNTIAAGETLTDEQKQVLEQWETIAALLSPTAEMIQEDIDAYQGNYSAVFSHRLPEAIALQEAGLFFLGWRILGIMLIGMALMKLGILSGEKSADFYRKLMLTGYALGLPLTVYSGLDLYAHDFDPIYKLRVGDLANAVGSIVVALGHIGLVMLVARTGYVPRLMARFGAVGRMALTNYLLHSVILTTVFYGYGLGLYGQLPRFAQMGFVIAVIGLQLILSPWWLRRFCFGPVEWLWKSLTYWRIQPMREPQA